MQGHANSGNANFPPGVAEAMAAQGLEPDATPAKPAAPVFKDMATRAKTIPLEHPFSLDGATWWDAITLQRLTADEVATAVTQLKGLEGPAADAWHFPIYRDATGALVPDVVLGAMDDDDKFVIEQEASSFLPRRFRAAQADVSVPSNGAATAP